MGEMYMPDSPNGGYRPLPKREFIVELADDGDRSLVIVRNDDVREAIVRCKDCAFSFDAGSRCRKWRGQDCFENSVPEHVEPNGFCSWGVARDGA